ncbi:hypothetical protein D6C98_06284 [Aureobasidium pullulans]|nr:hypothetical protein D6D26_09982 [Aureobasidium pullulans]THY49688.1 hypothetical protein D6C98_06284 [Aureobasidium pullulans]
MEPYSVLFGVPKLERILDFGRPPLHVRVFMANKQVYAETAPIFYSSNEFIADTDHLATTDSILANIRPDIRRLRLENKHTVYPTRLHASGLRNQHLSFIHHRLNVVTIKMPPEPPTKCSSRTVRESICAILAVGLLCTISALRKGRRAFQGPKGLLLQYAWYGAPVSSYLTLLRGLQDLPDLNFVARFEHVTYPRSSRDSNVIVLSRLEDEPVKRDTVDRPPVKIVGPNSHLKRKLPASPTSADPTPTKVRRLQLLQFLAFSESRNHNMSHQEVRDRFVGRNNELRRYINRAGLVLAPIPR